MKILLATDYYLPTIGGLPNAVYLLAKGLTKRKHRVFILAPSASWKFSKEEMEGVIIYRIRSIMVEKKRLVRYSPQFLHQKEVKKIIKEINPDIIHVHTPDFISSTAVHMGKRLRIPIVGTGHVMPENVYGALAGMFAIPEKVGKIVGNLYVRQMIQLFNTFNYVIAPTESGKKILQAFGLKVPIVAISNGIELERFTANKKHMQEIAKKYHIPSGIKVLYIGRLDKEKRIETLLMAMSLLPKREDISLIIAGVGTIGKDLQRYAKKLGVDAIFTGFVADEDLPALYNLSDIFVMPSTAELQCLVVMEAMAAGLPVVAANAVALPHLVKHGKNGFLFSPTDAKDLAHYIEFLADNKVIREKMGKESRKYIQSHTLSHIVKAIEEVYQKVITTYPAIQKKQKFSKKISKNIDTVTDWIMQNI